MVERGGHDALPTGCPACRNAPPARAIGPEPFIRSEAPLEGWSVIIERVHVEARSFPNDRDALRGYKTVSAHLNAKSEACMWRVLHGPTGSWIVVVAGDPPVVERLLRKAGGRLFLLGDEDVDGFVCRYLELKRLGPGYHETMRDGQAT